MNWRDYIHQDPAILAGKPVLKGTRLSVELILGYLAAGWSHETLLTEFPTLKPAHIPAVLGYAAALAHDARFQPLPTGDEVLS